MILPKLVLLCQIIGLWSKLNQCLTESEAGFCHDLGNASENIVVLIYAMLWHFHWISWTHSLQISGLLAPQSTKRRSDNKDKFYDWKRGRNTWMTDQKLYFFPVAPQNMNVKWIAPLLCSWWKFAIPDNLETVSEPPPEEVQKKKRFRSVLERSWWQNLSVSACLTDRTVSFFEMKRFYRLLSVRQLKRISFVIMDGPKRIWSDRKRFVRNLLAR